MNIVNFNKFDYHFFGKECFVDRNLLNLENLQQNLQLKNCKYQEILFLNQIHSSEVVVIDDYKKIYQNAMKPNADAIITNLKNVAIGLFTADCAPILLFEPNLQIIGAIHCGWRGAIAGIITKTIDKINSLANSRNLNLCGFIGPMIQQKSYQISQDFYNDFILKDFANKKFFISDREKDKYLFNLGGYIEEELRKSGVNNIFNSQIDTFTSDDFFSFRRAKLLKIEDCGRNVSLIALR